MKLTNENKTRRLGLATKYSTHLFKLVNIRLLKKGSAGPIISFKSPSDEELYRLMSVGAVVGLYLKNIFSKPLKIIS